MLINCMFALALQFSVAPVGERRRQMPVSRKLTDSSNLVNATDFLLFLL